MNTRRFLIGWFTALCLLCSLLQPGTLLAQDDDGGDDDDGDDSGPVVSDDDGGDDGDDDGDDDGPAPAPPPPASDDDDDDGPAPAPPVSDDVSDDDDDTQSPDLDFDDDDDDGEDRPVPNQVLVQLASGVDAEAFAARYGASVLRIIPVPNIALLQLDPDRDDDAELAALLADADLTWGEPNVTSQAPEGRPRYFFSSANGEPQLVDGPALPEGLEFTPAEACVTGDSVVVAVLDTGVDVAHPALAANVLPTGVNMLENTFDVRDVPNGIDDDNDGQADEMVGHGTHVAGTVLQVAPDAAILPVKVLDSDGVGDTFSVTAGMYYAVEQGADVINLSLGTTYESIAIQAAVDNAASQGVIVVAATGNGDRSLPVEYPASATSVISVASTTADADKASYSNYNELVDISAPGDSVSSAYPDGRYSSASGTSMSTPIVAGAIALILERQPDAAAESVYALLESTSGPLSLSDPALEGMLGAGEVDLDAAISCSG
ncbi:MAG: S8 family serine peptidase [Chloroflexota bacterium]|nr:S8 family serine peptidase [Chloroflexota bacterium]